MLDKICNERKIVVDLQHCHKDIKASLLYFYRINLHSKNNSLYVVERVGFVPFYCHDSNSSGLKIYLS